MYDGIFSPVRREFLATVLTDAATVTDWADVKMRAPIGRAGHLLYTVAEVKSHGMGGVSTTVTLASINLVLAQVQNGEHDRHFSVADFQRICTADAFNDALPLDNNLGWLLFQIAALGTVEFSA